MPKRINKRCEICNALMMQVHSRQRFCPDCRAARIRDSNRASAAAKRRRERSPYRRRSPADRREGPDIARIARLADAEGLTYGQYVAKHRI